MAIPPRSIPDSAGPVWHWLVSGLSVLIPSALLLGCATAPPARSAAEDAAEVERAQCGSDIDEQALAPVFAGDPVEAAEPLYTAVSSGGSGVGGNYSQLIGASIKLRALKGFTAVWLARALRCHSARRVLGRIPADALPNDPFWLPGKMVDLEVAATGAGYQVFIRGQNIKDAEKILGRANAFVEEKVRR